MSRSQDASGNALEYAIVSQIIMKIETKTAVCPHCGCDEFDINQSEAKRVRFLLAKTYPVRKAGFQHVKK